MESVAAHKDEVTHVESKIEELKRKSVDAKDVADHEAKNGNDEPVVKKIRKEAGDTDEDEKAHSPESRSAVAELDEDGTEGKLVYSLTYVPYTLNTK
ncbi:putative prothymosin alpha-B [Schistosoma mansoni]|uniref:Putative prothymosin alpha-B n=1 Tax=Schistosoma mansoni TaxID=6183 RepID=G4VNJ8_SCHMA|nr:putative prothymosin alpha-B [Schistosoma mansoni]|eukprot:XP_018654791.1 putative prothymosin alpha-B [Schistosoma mansoni]